MSFMFAGMLQACVRQRETLKPRVGVNILNGVKAISRTSAQIVYQQAKPQIRVDHFCIAMAVRASVRESVQINFGSDSSSYSGASHQSSFTMRTGKQTAAACAMLRSYGHDNVLQTRKRHVRPCWIQHAH